MVCETPQLKGMQFSGVTVIHKIYWGIHSSSVYFQEHIVLCYLFYTSIRFKDSKIKCLFIFERCCFKRFYLKNEKTN